MPCLASHLNDIIIVGEARTGIEAIKWTRSHHTDVILMDLNMPEMGGLEATQRILQMQPDMKILILTVHSDTIYPFRVLRAGALGYLTKTSLPDELFQAIRQVAAGGNYLPTLL